MTVDDLIKRIKQAFESYISIHPKFGLYPDILKLLHNHNLATFCKKELEISTSNTNILDFKIIHFDITLIFIMNKFPKYKIYEVSKLDNANRNKLPFDIQDIINLANLYIPHIRLYFDISDDEYKIIKKQLQKKHAKKKSSSDKIVMLLLSSII